MRYLKQLAVLFVLFVLAQSQMESDVTSNGTDDSQDDEFQERDSCDEDCENQQDEASCIEECEYNYIVTLVSIYTSVFGFPLLIFLIVFRVVRYKNRVQSLRQRLRNTVENKMVSQLNQEGIEKQVNDFKLSRWELSFQQETQTHQVTSFDWKLQQTKMIGKWEFNGSGSDQFGNWKCQGLLYFPDNTNITLWMLKDYDDKEFAGQTGEWQYLIYQGVFDVEIKEFNGDWYYEKFIGHPYYRPSYLKL